MSNIQYSIVSSGDDSFVTAFIPGEPAPLVAARSGHPNFDAIVEFLVSGDYESSQEIVELFDVEQAVAKRFENLSDRVQVGNGRVLFDGCETDNSLTKQIVRFLEEGHGFEPLVAFMEKVMDNPQEHSRQQLFDWLDHHDFTITSDGMIVGYKGVASDGDGSYRSIGSGTETVYVDGEPHQGQIPNPVGAVVNMDRGLVQHDPSIGCHRGLHVGTYEYARDWSHGTVLEVHVNPRDVVSVPTDCNWAKIRTCRYTIADALDAPYSSGLLEADGSDLDDEGWNWDADDDQDDTY